MRIYQFVETQPKLVVFTVAAETLDDALLRVKGNLVFVGHFQAEEFFKSLNYTGGLSQPAASKPDVSSLEAMANMLRDHGYSVIKS